MSTWLAQIIKFFIWSEGCRVGKHPWQAIPPTTSCPFSDLLSFLLKCKWRMLTSSALLFKLDPFGRRSRPRSEAARLFREGVQGLPNPHVLYLPPYTRTLSHRKLCFCQWLSLWVSLPLSSSHFFQHISLKLTGWLTYVSQLALKAWLSNWIMDFSTQHQLSYVAVCGSMSGSKLWVGTRESLYRGVCMKIL